MCFDFFCVDVVLVLDVAFAWYAGCVEVFVYFLVSLVDDPKLRVFNREPAERATDQGGLRLAARFRSSAVLSAEVTPRSGDLGAGLTAGHRRRVTVLSSRPLSDRGLGASFAEGVNELFAFSGGSVGDLLVSRVRSMSRQDFSELWDECCAFVNGVTIGAGVDVDVTQRKSLSVQVAGFVVLARAAGGLGLVEAFGVLRPLLELFVSGVGGVTTSGETVGAEFVLNSVRQFCVVFQPRILSSDPSFRNEQLRLMSTSAPPLGRWVKRRGTDGLSLLLFSNGLKLLERDFGVSGVMLQACTDDGFVEGGVQTRVGSDRLRGTLFNGVSVPDGAEDGASVSDAMGIVGA